MMTGSVSLAAVMVYALGQAAEPSAIVNPIVNVSAFGLMAWLVWHTNRVSIPKLQELFFKALADQRAELLTDLRTARNDFLLDLRNERAVIQAMAAAFDRVHDRLKVPAAPTPTPAK